MAKYHLTLILTSLMIVGCSGFKELRYRHSQKKRAQVAWKAAGPTDAGADYKDGWQTGYYDLAMGSNGHVPPVPPKKYWSDKYQNPAGQQCVTGWYAGYQDGVIAAEQVGEYEWQLVPSSGVAALPHVAVIDSPTFYRSPPTDGHHLLPEPLPTDPPVTSEHRQPPTAPPQGQSNDAIAATSPSALDLRTLTGRPAAPTIVSQPEQLAIPAPPAPHRDLERVPQPSGDLQIATNARENDQPFVPPAQASERIPAVPAEQYLAIQPERAEVSRVENTPVPPPQRIANVPSLSPAVTSHEPRHQSAVLAEDKQLPPTASVRETAPVPNTVTKERLVSEWPATIAAPSPAISSAPNLATEPTPSIVSTQRLANPPAKLEASETGSALTPRSISNQPPADRSSNDKTPIVDAKPTEPKLHREQVVSQQPTSAARTYGEPLLGAPVIKSAPPISIRQIEDHSNLIIQSMTATPQATVSEPTTKITQSMRTLTKPTTETPTTATWVAARTQPAPAPTATNMANSVAAPTHRPIVVAAQPIQIRAELAVNRPPEQTVESPNPTASVPADNIEPIVKMAEPFPLNPSDTQPKPIVVVARPFRLSEASTMRR